jgi:cytochrome P450
VIPSNAREATEDTSLPRGGGADGSKPLFVGKGTVVLYNIYAMHRNKDVFGDDADDFIPERWERLQPGWSYLPWNGGPRVCLGRK